MSAPAPDSKLLIKLVETPMPFGKYQGRLLVDLPEPYLLWFQRKGFPPGEIGYLLHLTLEINVSGCIDMVKRLKYA